MTTYRRTGKEVLHGKMHVADAATEEMAALIVDALNEYVRQSPPTPDPDQYVIPYDDGVKHDVRRQSDEYFCICGARWDVADGEDHP